MEINMSLSENVIEKMIDETDDSIISSVDEGGFSNTR